MLLLLACGGGGGDGPADDGVVDLSGWWETWVQAEGSADPFQALGVFRAVDDRTRFHFDAESLTRTPNGVSGALPDAGHPNRDEWVLELDAAGDLVGTLTTYFDHDVESRFDARVVRRGPPGGEFVIFGTHADVHSTTAWARRWVPLYRTLEVVHSDPEVPVVLLVAFNGVPPWAAGTYDVGAAELQAAVIVAGDQTSAVTGHVTFTRLDDERAEGSFDLELDGGGQATGSFSAEILVDIVP